MEKSLFFNARETQPGVYDRVYQAEEFAAYFAKFIGNGVFPNPSTGLQVVQNSTPDMTTVLSAGSAYINGYTYINDAPLVFTHKVADGTLNRKDAIFIRFDKAGRAITAYKMESSLSTDPVAPSIVRTSDYYDLCVGVVNIKAGITKITQDLIEDTRMNKSVCGIVTGVVNQVDTTTLYNQIQSDLKYFKNVSQADFDAWFEDINNKLGTEPATNLQNQVNKLNDAIGGLELELSNKTNTVSLNAIENRVGNVSVDGFTIQSGSGDASPANVRGIENAGMYNKRITINENSGLSLSGTGSIVGTSRRINLITPDIPPVAPGATGKVLCSILPTKPSGGGSGTFDTDGLGISVQSDSSVVAINFRVPGCMTIEDYKAWLKNNPLDVIYLSTENTGEFYTGVPVEQGDNYHCDIVKLKDRLHSGDKLDTNILSEYDEFVEFDGSLDENWLIEDGSVAGASGSKRFWVKLPGKQTENTSTKVAANASSNYLEVTTSDDAYNGKYDNVFDVVYTSSTNMIHIRVAGISTVEALKTRLQSHPLRVFYKSASTGAPKSIKREKYAKATYALTGNENWVVSGTGSGETQYFSAKITDANIKILTPGTDICSHFKVTYITQSNKERGIGAYNNIVQIRHNDFSSVDELKIYLSAQYIAGTPVTVEYELAAHQIYADIPVEVKNPRGTFKVSSEVNSVITVGVKPDPDIPTLEDLGAEPAFEKNTAFNKNFGKVAGTVCEGNDTRLSDARRSSNITMSRSGTTLNITYS